MLPEDGTYRDINGRFPTFMLLTTSLLVVFTTVTLCEFSFGRYRYPLAES